MPIMLLLLRSNFLDVRDVNQNLMCVRVCVMEMAIAAVARSTSRLPGSTGNQRLLFPFIPVHF